jgi:hypothetical protein
VSLEIIKPRDKFLLKQGFFSTEAVLGHLELVLKSFASKPEYSRFYIGVTMNLEQRMVQHRAKGDLYRLMCPIVEEESPKALQSAFDGLEQAAIERFNPGVVNTATKKVLMCGNVKPGIAPKSILYILVG